MKIFGSITELVKVVLRKSGFAVTVEPSTASADTTFQLPAAGGGTKTLVTTTESQTISDKTIDNSNTIDAEAIADGSVTNTEFQYLNGVTSAIQTQLDGKVDENAAITGATKTKITYDSKGLVTAGADLAASDLPTGIDAAKIADGSVSNTEFQYINSVTSNVQTQLNSKAASGANSDITSLSGLTTALSIGQGGTGQTTANAALNALLPTQSGNTNKFLKTDGTNTTWGSAGGGVGKNYLQDQYDADTPISVQQSVGDVLASSTRLNPTYFGSSTTADLISVSTNSSLRGTANYLIQFTANAQFIETPLFTLDGSDLGKALSVQFDVTGVGTDNDVQVYVVRYNSSNVLQERIPVAGSASSTTPFSAKLPTGTKTFNGFFIPSSTASDKYALRILRNANNTSMRIDALVVGPNQVLQGAIVTDWQTFTPTLVGGATNLTLTGRFKRLGDTAEVMIRVDSTASTTWGPAGTSLKIGIAGVGTINSALVSNRWNLGTVLAITSGYVGYTGNVMVGNAATTYVECHGGYPGGDSWSFKASGAPADFPNNTAGQSLNMHFFMPITEWQSNTQQAARAVEEYAYNTSAWDADDSSSFGYGPQGQQITTSTNLTTQREKRVRFQTPILPTDKIEIEIQRNGAWVPAVGSILNSDIPVYSFGFGATFAKANSIGIGWGPISGSSTDVLVVFGRYCSLYNGATGQEWGTAVSTSTVRWRVKKVSGGAAVGFPVGARNVIGDTTGTAVPTSYIGERITFTTTSVTGGSGSWVANSTSMGSLTTGVWLVCMTGEPSPSSACNHARWVMSTNSTNDGTGAIVTCGTTYAANANAANQPMVFMQSVYVASATTPLYAKGFGEDATVGINVSGYAVRIA